MKEKLIIVILFLLAIILALFNNKSSSYIKNSKLYISEIVAKNNNIIKDEYGAYGDYIELYNGFNYDIDLSGYYLSDSEYKTKKWMFPKIIIKAKSYLLVFADNKNICDKYCHTNFKLSSSGEAVILTDHSGNIISKVLYDNLLGDESVEYAKSKYIKTYEGSPLEKNKTGEEKITNIKKYKIIINEYMSRNSSIHSINGYTYDWVELYNTTDNDLDLVNLYISDSKDNLRKQKIPQGIIKAKDYYVIDLTNFGITTNEEIVISNGEKIIDSVLVKDLTKNSSCGLKNDEWVYFPTPTRGSANNTASFKEWVVDNGNT